MKKGDLNKKLIARLTGRRLPTRAQFKHIGTTLAPRERQIVRIAAIAAGLSAVWLIAVFLITHIDRAPARGGEYSEAIVGAPTYVNPLYAPLNDADADLVRLIFSGLMRRTPEGTMVGDLGDSLEASDDGKTYTARLRTDRFFHDGKPVTVDDVLFTMNAIKNPEYRSALHASFRSVAIEAADEHTVKFTLQEPFAAFPELLTVGILPAHLWADVPPSGATLAEWNVKPIGAGPYKFHSFVRDRLGNIKSYTLARATDGSYLDRVILRFHPSPETARAALQSRSVDGVAFVPSGSIPKNRKKVEAVPLRLPQLTAVFFNQRKNAALADANIRRALTIATDRVAVMNAALPEGAELADGPIPADAIPSVDRPTPPAFDQAFARELLDKAGWKLSAEGSVREKVTRDRRGRVTASSTLSVALTTVDREEHRAAAEKVAEAWRAIGVGVEITFVPAKEIQKTVIRPREYEALLYGLVYGPDTDPFPFWHSSQAAESGSNLANYTNRNADDLLVAARRTTDAALRAAKLNDFQKLVVAEFPAIFLYRPDYRYVISTAIKGITVGRVGTPADRFAGITDWYRRTKPTWK